MCLAGHHGSASRQGIQILKDRRREWPTGCWGSAQVRRPVRSALSCVGEVRHGRGSRAVDAAMRACSVRPSCWFARAGTQAGNSAPHGFKTRAFSASSSARLERPQGLPNAAPGRKRAGTACRSRPRMSCGARRFAAHADSCARRRKSGALRQVRRGFFRAIHGILTPFLASTRFRYGHPATLRPTLRRRAVREREDDKA